MNGLCQENAGLKRGENKMEENQNMPDVGPENSKAVHMETENAASGRRETEGNNEKEKTAKKRGRIILAAGISIGLLAAGAAAVYFICTPKGYKDYTVRMQQYYVEYSDEYDYWDVLTIEYPRIEGIDEKQQDMINDRLYDTAMDRSNYWHFEPDAYVKELQKNYSIYSSDVDSTVRFHSQSLLSVEYAEIYAPANVVWYVSMTKRALNVDLLSGESYELSDIIRLDREFIEFWTKRANEQYVGFFGEDEESQETLLSWFLKSDEEWNAYYELQPYFYVTEGGEFIVGISINPKFIDVHEPQEDFYEICCNARELDGFRTASPFWEKYDLSRQVGEVFECTKRNRNIWLGDISGIWDYWEEKGDLLSE